MLTPMSRAPQQICLNWIKFQAIGRHPLTNYFHATQQLGGRIISMLRLSTGVEQAMKNWEGEKFQAKNFCSCPHTIPVCPHLLGHMPFCPPVEAIHAVTIMSLKAIGLQYL